jgi:hypothetical protein
MRRHAEPLVAFNTRVPVETDRLRRELQKVTGWSGSELVTEALHFLATNRPLRDLARLRCRRAENSAPAA